MLALTTYDMIELGDCFYFVCNEFNALVRCEREKKSVLLDSIPEESIFARSLISQLLYYDGKIIFIPLNAKKIWLYSIEQMKWSSIEIDEPECEFKFMKAVCYNNRVYMLPSRYKKVAILDLQTGMISYLDIMKDLISNNSETVFRSDIVVDNEYLISAYCGGDCVFKMNMKDNSFSWIEVGNKSEGYSGIVSDGTQYWLVEKGKRPRVYSCDKDFKRRKLKYDGKDDGKDDGLVRGITIINNSIYVNKTNETIVLSLENADIIKREKPYFVIKEYNNSFYLLGYDGKCEVISQMDQNHFVLEILEEERDEFVSERVGYLDQDCIKETGITVEDSLYGLLDFIKTVSVK